MNLEGDNSNQAVDHDSAPLFLRRHDSEQGHAAVPPAAAAAAAADAAAAPKGGDSQSARAALEAAATAAGIASIKADDSRRGDKATATSASAAAKKPASKREALETGKRRPKTAVAAAAAPKGRRSDDNPSVVPTKKPSRRTWKKPEGMPKRPLSAYNLFFRSERQLLLGEKVDISSGGVPPAAAAKRKHRKTHGKVSFHEMANLVSEKWKGMAKEDKLPFEQQAAHEKLRYREELEQWKLKQRLVAESALQEASTGKSATVEQYFASIAAATASVAPGSASGERGSDNPEDDNEEDSDSDSSDSESDDDEHDHGTDEGGSKQEGQLGVSGRSGAGDSVSTSRGASAGASADAGRKKKSKHGDSHVRQRRRHEEGAPREAAIPGPPPFPSEKSPRSETAALLVAMPNTAGAPGMVLQGVTSAVAVTDPRGVAAEAGMPYAATSAAETVMQDSTILLGPPHAYGLPRGVAPSVPLLMAGQQQPSVGPQDWHLQERYSVLMEEATAVRMAMQRNQNEIGSMARDGSMPPPPVMIPPRRHSEGVYPASYFNPMDVRRFSDNPRTLNLLRASQSMPLPLVDPSQGPHVGMPTAFVVDSSSLQAPLSSQPVFPAVPSQATIEQAQLDLIALERAAELRRADLARWGQQAVPPAMALRPSPPPMWAASPLQGALPTPAAQQYPAGIQQVPYALPNAAVPQAQHLQPTSRLYSPPFQAVVPQGGFASTSQYAPAMSHAYLAPAGATVETMRPSLSSEMEAAPPQAPSSTGQPPAPPGQS